MEKSGRLHQMSPKLSLMSILQHKSDENNKKIDKHENKPPPLTLNSSHRMDKAPKRAAAINVEVGETRTKNVTRIKISSMSPTTKKLETKKATRLPTAIPMVRLAPAKVVVETITIGTITITIIEVVASSSVEEAVVAVAVGVETMVQLQTVMITLKMTMIQQLAWNTS